MSGYENDMVGGLDTLFAEQAKLDGVCLVDYVQFDTEYEVVFEDTLAADAKAVLVPRGGTALLDAVGKSVTQLGEKFAKLDEDDRPGTVVVVVVTDGYENSSTEWTAAQVKELIEKHTNDWNWTFTFLGANLDAVAEGSKFGFTKDTSLTYTQGNESLAFATASNLVTNTRTVGSYSYTDEERAANAK